MMASRPEDGDGMTDVAAASVLFAIDPTGMGGVNVRAHAGAARDRWLAGLRSLLPPDMPVRKVPLHVGDDRLLGGLDIAATLRAGRPVADRGILAEANGGIAVLAMAERMSSATVARVAAVLDAGKIGGEREGVTACADARIAVVALDEGCADDELVASALLDRMAFHLDLTQLRHDAEVECWHLRHEVDAARQRLGAVRATDETIDALCETALALGIASIRAPLLALRVARAAASLAGRDVVSADDAALAARLVLAPRATTVPATDPQREPDPTTTDRSAEDGDARPDDVDTRPNMEPTTGPNTEPNAELDAESDTQDTATADPPKTSASHERLGDIVLDAARAAIPAHLLAQLASAHNERGVAHSGGRVGALRRSALRGRPSGVRRGEPRSGARMSLIETLRAAAPWQPLRRLERERDATAASRLRVDIRREDFRVAHFQQRSETTTVFVVDASGSSAMHRLAEAKGAAEMLLADCYLRRDRVALIAFRDRGSQLLLAPTRSLVRAKRSLAELPGGGGTPLASGIDAALAIAIAIARRGGTPTIVLLTDGRGNIARDGTPGRAKAHADALASARALRVAGIRALLIDTSPRQQELATQLAREMGARYLALPDASAETLSTAIRDPLPTRRGGAADHG